jgi:hypothetical protein
MTLRDQVELAILGCGKGSADLAAATGECIDILLEEGILIGNESATNAIDEVILQAVAEGCD